MCGGYVSHQSSFALLLPPLPCMLPALMALRWVGLAMANPAVRHRSWQRAHSRSKKLPLGGAFLQTLCFLCFCPHRRACCRFLWLTVRSAKWWPTPLWAIRAGSVHGGGGRSKKISIWRKAASTQYFLASASTAVHLDTEIPCWLFAN